MRVSRLFARTLREDPAEAEVPSHRLLLRAAFIRKVAAGIYTTMPLGLRTMAKIERVVREEMDASGAQELRMPIVLPAEPWKRTGRWDAYGDEIFRLEDRHGREFLLGPTQEEVVAPLVQQEFPSYKDLPVNVYQVEWKYRDERRPRYGLLRGREFLMKDAYTFDRDEDGMRESYRVMYEAYERVFDRLGLDIRDRPGRPRDDRRRREPRVHGARRRRRGPVRPLRERRLPRGYRGRDAARTRADGPRRARAAHGGRDAGCGDDRPDGRADGRAGRVQR